MFGCRNKVDDESKYLEEDNRKNDEGEKREDPENDILISIDFHNR
jgi:hypothetical protein